MSYPRMRSQRASLPSMLSATNFMRPGTGEELVTDGAGCCVPNIVGRGAWQKADLGWKMVDGDRLTKGSDVCE